MANTNPITRKEFNILRAQVKTADDLKVLARETGRSVETLRKVRRTGTWPKYLEINKKYRAQQNAKNKLQVVPPMTVSSSKKGLSNVAKHLRRESAANGLFDSNLTPEQEDAWTNMQLDLNLANSDRKAKQQKINRLETELDIYRKREIAEITKKARANRSILRFLRRTNS